MSGACLQTNEKYMTGNLKQTFRQLLITIYNRVQVFRVVSKLKEARGKNPNLSPKCFIFGKLFGEIPQNLQAK